MENRVAVLLLLVALAVMTMEVSGKAKKANNNQKNHATVNANANKNSKTDGSGNVNTGSQAKKHPPLTGYVAPTKEGRKKHPKFKAGLHSIAASRQRGVLLIPPAFDARTKWPLCDSIKTVRGQGACGTCWSVTASSVLSDRICIQSNQTKNIFISANQASSCPWVPPQNSSMNCISGGYDLLAFSWANFFGFPTGGETFSGIGCVPYPDTSISATLSCQTQCTNPAYKTPMSQDIYTIDTYYRMDNRPIMDSGNISAISTLLYQIKSEILVNGPVAATIDMYDNFAAWSVSDGAYRGPPVVNQSLSQLHTIKLVGWNKDQNGIPYWIVSNSWGPDWAQNGFWWVEMGKNVISIESTISVPIVKASIPNTCSVASFCDSPIGHVINFATTFYPIAPTYAFQGDCAQLMTVDSQNRMTAVGTPSPISIVGVNGPSTGKIVNYRELKSGVFLLINTAGEYYACTPVTGSIRLTCYQTGDGIVETNFRWGTPPAVVSYAYYPTSPNSIAMWGNPFVWIPIGDLITDYFSIVTAFENVGGNKMTVRGKGLEGQQVVGVLAFPVPRNGPGFSWLTPPTDQTPYQLQGCGSSK